jgi:hypothetical protein
LKVKVECRLPLVIEQHGSSNVPLANGDLLRERWSVIGRMCFIANEGDFADKSKVSEALSGSKSTERGANDED